MTKKKPPLDPFDVQLSQQLHNGSPYINDDGFSQNVIKNLPNQSRAQLYRRRLLLITSVLGLCLITPAIATTAISAIHWANNLTLSTLLQIGVVTSGALLTGTLVWLARELDLV